MDGALGGRHLSRGRSGVVFGQWMPCLISPLGACWTLDPGLGKMTDIRRKLFWCSDSSDFPQIARDIGILASSLGKGACVRFGTRVLVATALGSILVQYVF